jgi:phospholipid transport system substrate-binding protein
MLTRKSSKMRQRKSIIVAPSLEALLGKESTLRGHESMGARARPVLCLCVLALWGLCGVADKEPSDPAATVQSLLSAVSVLSETKDPKAEAEAVKRISGTFDVVGLSRACLQKTWDELSGEERKNFVSLFKEVLEKIAYPKSAKFFTDTEVEVEEIIRENGKAEVSTLVVHPEEGEVEVGYCLELLDGTWLIEDILLDGVSLRLDLRSQTQKILREESYERLKRRLREKLNE